MIGAAPFPAKLTAIRSVFAAMFDAVETMGEFDESKWIDLIAAFNATGRLVFGWPHLKSSESDIFGALDDIAMELAVTKEAIEGSTTDARVILAELREAIGMDDQAPSVPTPIVEPPTEYSDPIPEPAPVAVSTPVIEAPPPPPVIDEAKPNRRQGPHYDREAMFSLLRGRPSLNAAAKELGISGKAVRDRLDVLEGHGELPDDIYERFRRRKGPTVAPIVALPEQEPEPAEPAEESFEDRRKRLAKERADATWRQLHPEATA